VPTAKYGGTQISPAAVATETVGLVFLSVTFFNIRVCVHDFAMKVFEYRNDFDTVG